MNFSPMLAKDADLERLYFPLLASAKLDGIRAIVINSVVFSRSLKPIPNKFIQLKYGRKEYEGLDGELIIGDPWDKEVYRKTVSGVMSIEGEPDVKFYAFDTITHPTLPYQKRVPSKERPHVVNLPQHVVTCMNTLLELETVMLEKGYEGLILRHPNAPYKYGRSTVKEGYLLKLKRFVDAEAEVIGFEERMHNGNEATTNELGRTKRSSHRSGKTGMGDLGAIQVRFGDVEFRIGTGFNDSERDEIWSNQSKYLGAVAKFKYFAVGVKDAPRHPVFLGWRAKEDMS